MAGRRDEEAAGSVHEFDGNVGRYHDDPDDVDDADTDAPLLRTSQRPSSEIDDLFRQRKSTWQDKIAARIPPQLKTAWAATVTWVQGPKPPRIYTIDPIFPKIQHAPIALLDRYLPRPSQRFWLLMAFYACWLFAFAMVLWKSSFSAEIPGYGSPMRLGCQARSWNDGNGCGINGDQCRPFSNATLAFRCPAACAEIEMLRHHAVGDQDVVYQSLLVGGPTERHTGYEDEVHNNAIYRGDSFICAAAVHSGFLNDAEGGCGVLTLTGEQFDFPSTKSHGIRSVGFDSHFPHSFGFLAGSKSQCKDLRWSALGVSVTFSVVLSLFTTSAPVFFWSHFVNFFFTTALATDPPALTDYYSLLSIAFGRFLPACFCGWVTYRYTAKRTLTDLTAQIEKTILWLGPAWVGTLNSVTFDKIPIERLTPHDIKAQPGAVPALIIIVLSIFFIALGQAWAFRVEGRMPRYLALYTLFVASLLLMVAVPGLNLRIHHYILALLLLPGTSFQNRPSLVYQGLLVGLFVNGIARWGFDSILQTPTELLKGVQQGSILPAISVLATTASNITFNLGPLPRYDEKLDRRFDGVSVLVNDVEQFRGYGDNRQYWDSYVAGANFSWTWERYVVHTPKDVGKSSSAAEGEDGGLKSAGVKVLPEYFRFGYMGGSTPGDFTKAGKWDEDGEWHEMEGGPS